MQQRPCRAPRLEKYVVDLQPWRAHFNRVGLTLCGLGRRIAGEPLVDHVRSDAVAQAARHAPQPLFDLGKPFAQAVGTCVKLCFRAASAGQPVPVTAESLDRVAVLRFGSRQYPRLVVKEKLWLGRGEIGILRRLRLAAAVVVARDAREVAYLREDAVLPVGHVVEPDAGRHDVVGQVAAALVEQGLRDPDQSIGRREANHAPLVVDVLVDPEKFGHGRPVHAEQYQEQKKRADRCGDDLGPAEPGHDAGGGLLIHGRLVRNGQWASDSTSFGNTAPALPRRLAV